MSKQEIKRTFKLDLSSLLKALDTRNYNFYSTLTDDEKKGFAGIVAMRYLSNVSDKNRELCEYYLQIVNDAANKHFWNSEIQKHPELQYLILANCGIGTSQFHQWIKGPTKKKQNKVMLMLKEFYPTANENELQLFFDINSNEQILDIANMLGYQFDTIKEIKKELKNIRGSK